MHYYWGIPFCPQGLDPDRYTQVGGAQRRQEVSDGSNLENLLLLHQVIVAQMEVFEKSLKMAQRNLLRKAEWGEGIQPQPEAQQEVTSPPNISSSQLPPTVHIMPRPEDLPL